MTAEIPRSVRLRLALVFVIVAAETVLEVAFLIGREGYGPGGKALIGSLFALKVVFAHLVRRLSAGAVFGLLLFELAGLPVVFGASFAIELRVLLLGCVLATFALVASCLHAFPSPEIH